MCMECMRRSLSGCVCDLLYVQEEGDANHGKEWSYIDEPELERRKLMEEVEEGSWVEVKS